MDREYLESELQIATEQVALAHDQIRIPDHNTEYRFYLWEKVGYWGGRRNMLENLLAELEDN
jgi:hypothetical protein